MSKRAALSPDERLVFEDFLRLIEPALEKRKRLCFEKETLLTGDERAFAAFVQRRDEWFAELAGLAPEEAEHKREQCKSELDELERAMFEVKYRNPFGEEMTAEEYERTREQRESELDKLERAIMPLAEAARPPVSAGASLRKLLYPTTGLLPLGSPLRNSAADVERREDLLEYAYTWGVCLLARTHERAIAIGEISRALEHLAKVYGIGRKVTAADGKIEIKSASKSEIEDEFLPQTPKQRARGNGHIANALAELTGMSADTILRDIRASDARIREGWGVKHGLTVMREQARRNLGEDAKMLRYFAERPPLDPLPDENLKRP